MTNLKESLSPDAFAMLTLEAQIEHLTALLPDEQAENLVELCAQVRDPAPLAWLCRRLVERNWLASAPNRQWLAAFLIRQAETTVHKVLRSITEPPLKQSDREPLAALMIEMLKKSEVKELSSICLVDRALRHHFSQEHDLYLAQLLAQCTQALSQGAPDKITLEQLAQLPAKDIPALYAAASASATTKALDDLRQRLSVEAIEVLGDAPKAVSQANAEDLLARRVYTDPGHFLIELLQNAEDSGARHWRVLFDAARIVVWHDGAPFDARDVVGVTSIGQTTKRKQQIGFFGVGFKSVYEVTDRPQIYSDIWKFEIADVSIPKVLARRPDYLQTDGTVLVLPLRANLDHERSPKSLYEKASQLDACVLLTLRSIDVIELELTAAAGGPARHEIIEGVRQERSSIRHEPSGNIRTYWIRDDRYEYDLKSREAGRADETMVMVGVLFDEEHHKPIQLEDGAATVYSYLPTREKTGLRFFVQGHFDVPLDRERIAPDSEWNRWILSQVPHQLAHMANKLSLDNDLKSAEGFLDVLPLKSELPQSLFQLIVDGLKPALQAISFVPAVDDSLRSPENILVAPPQIAALFQGQPVSADRFLLNPSLNVRAQELVLSIGAAPFDTAQLLIYLESLAPTFANGTPPEAPAFLSDFNLLESLYDILLAEADRLEREGARAALELWLERLKKLPIITDADGRLAPPQRLARGSASFRAIYSGIFKFVDPRLENAAPRTLAFLNRTGVLSIDVEYMVEHLERVLGSAPLPLSSPQAVPFPGTEQRLSLILQVLADAGWEHQKRASALPLFQSIAGVYWPVAQASSDMKGVLRVKGELASELAKFYGQRRPLADVNDTKNPSSVLLDRLKGPLLDLSVLCEDLAAKLFGRDLQTLRQLQVLLESVEEEISDKVAKQLCDLAIWPDHHGDGRPLRGAYKVFIPENEELCALFAQAPFLDKDTCARKHIKRLGVAAIGANNVVEALDDEAKPPLAIVRNAENMEKALAYLLRNAGSLDAKSRTELKGMKAFLSDDKIILHLSQLSLAISPQLRTLYGSWRMRHFLNPEGTTFKLIRALAFDSSLAKADAATLIADLENPERGSLIPNRESLVQILAYLAGEAESIPGSSLARLAKMPIFPDQKGTFGSLPSRNAARSPSMVPPCEASVRPLLNQAGVRLLDAEIERVIKPILDQLHTPYAGLEELVEYLTTCPQLPDTVVEPLQKMLVERKGELSKLYPLLNEPGHPMVSPILNSLPIWKARSGQLLRAAEVVAPGAGEIIGESSPESVQLNQRTIDDPSFQRLKALAPLVAPMPCEQFICDLVARVAQDKQPLSAQPRFLSAVDRVNQINALIASQPDAAPVYVDALNRLRLEPLYYTNASTYALLEKLPLLEELLHPDFQQVLVQKSKSDQREQQQQGFGKHVQSIAGFFRKFTGDGGLAPMQPAAVAVDCDPLPWHRVILALGDTLAEKKRPLFYAWLGENEDDIYSDSEARKLLAAAPFFRTRGNAMVCPRDLVIETDLPDIGLDWSPSPEIPEPVLIALQKHLNVGRPKLNDLIKRNVVPAYIEACEKGDKDKAGQLMQWLAQRLSDRAPAQIRELILTKETEKKLLFEDAHGSFRSMEDLVIPAARIAEFLQAIWGADLQTPSPSRYSPFVISFLSDLGIAGTPSLPMIRIKLQNPQSKGVCLGLAGLVCYLRNQNGELVHAQLPLRTSTWLQDGSGAFRAAPDLFVKSTEIECIAGSYPELYLADGLYEVLGDTLARELKFRTVDSITFEDVARHIMKRTENRTPPNFAVYAWLDQQVQKKRVDTAGLNRLFGAKPWIWTDDSEVFLPAHVLGLRAFHLFKSRRGYWERGFKECRALCHALGIPGTATPDMVAGFVEELGNEARGKGSGKVLAEEPALPHMLLAAFAILGDSKRAVDRDLPIIPCSDTRNETDLLPASAKNLFWSDTPTLDVLFSKAGPLCLAMRGRLEEREGVETFHQLMAVRRLRDAYRLVADDQSGVDRSEQKSTQIIELRSTLRALVSVLPRIELERPLTAPSAWVYRKRLRALTEKGVIKAVDNLGVRYVLPGVGETRVQQMATYHEDDDSLVVDTRVLNDSERTGLAEGLIASIVEGPMADSFIDLVEILLARVSKERMNEYLNRRHFAESMAPAAASEVIAERISEILDYGLDRKLKRSFPPLAECALERWTDAALLSKIEKACTDGDIKQAAHKVVPILLDALALKDVPQGLPAALEKMLAAQTLSDASSVLVETSKEQSLVVVADKAQQPDNHDKSAHNDGQEDGRWLFSMAKNAINKLSLADHADESGKSLAKSDEGNDGAGKSKLPADSPGQETVLELKSNNPKNVVLLAAGAAGVLIVIVGVLLFFMLSAPGGGAVGAAIDPVFLKGLIILLLFGASAAGITGVLYFPPTSRALKKLVQNTDVLITDSWTNVKDWWLSIEDSEFARELQNTLNPSPSENNIRQDKPGNGRREIGRTTDDAPGDQSNGKRESARTGSGASHLPGADSSPLRIESDALPLWTKGNGFKPFHQIGPQLWATRANRKTVAAKPPDAQLRFSPPNLPPPYLYAVHQLGVTFDPATQTWNANENVKSQLNTPGFPSSRYVQFEGVMQPGQNQLPLPLYGRIVGGIEIDGIEMTTFDQDALTAFCQIRGTSKATVKYRVQLLETPKLEGRAATAISADSALLQPTVSLEDLPEQVQEWLENTRSKEGSYERRALAAQTFIRRHYAYDDGFLERPEVRRARSRLPKGKGNHHLALLHASGEGSLLGRGVCYELNVLLVELLRRLEVPALTATGWVLNGGIADLPDHLFALAVVPSAQGACVLVLDAASTDRGPITSLSPHRRAFPNADLTGPAPLPAVPAPKGAWDITPRVSNIRFQTDGLTAPSPGAKATGKVASSSDSSSSRSSSSGSGSSSGSRSSSGSGSSSSRTADDHDFSPSSDRTIAPAEKAKKRFNQAEIALMRDAIQRVCTATGAPPARNIPDDLDRLSLELHRLFGDRVVAETYLLILRGDLYRLDAISPQVDKLVNMGLAHIEPLSAYKVAPIDPGDL